MSQSAHLTRLNQQLALRSAFSLCIGNPKARAAIAAKLAELSHVRVDVDAADFDSEFGAQRTDAYCDELTDHTETRVDLLVDSDGNELSFAEKMKNPHFAQAFYDAREQPPTPKAIPTMSDPQTKMRRNAVVNRYRPPGREPTPKEQERMDAAGREFDEREAFKKQQSRTRAGSVTRLDNNLDNDVDVPSQDEETKKARARAKHRAANAWRVGPLTPAEQRQVDLDRAGRDPDDAA